MNDPQDGRSQRNLGFWTALGIALGAGVGVALNNLALWTGVGVALGAALGSIPRGRRSDGPRPSAEEDEQDDV